MGRSSGSRIICLVLTSSSGSIRALKQETRELDVERMQNEDSQDQLRRNYPAVITSLIHIESRKSPTAVLFDVDTRRIFIVSVNTKEYHFDVLAKSQG
ncbi:hypothetical protein Tco_0854587 [Tanacetum coccineum]